MFCSNMNTQWNPEECVCVCVWGGGGGGGGGGRRGGKGGVAMHQYDFHDNSNIQYHIIMGELKPAAI